MRKLIFTATILSSITSNFAMVPWGDAVQGEYVIKTVKNIKFNKNIKSDLGIISMKKVFDKADSDVFLIKVEHEFTKKDKSILEDSGILKIEPNYIYSINNYIPSDKLYSWQWALDNRGDNEPRRGGGRIPIPGVVGADMNISSAWDQSLGKRQIKIAVVDTGIDYKHKDLKANIWTNDLEKNGKKGIDDDGNGYVDDVHGYDFFHDDPDPMDDNKHGTHVAGIIGASHNEIGVAGVMKDVSLVAVKFMDKKGRGDLDKALRGIQYAIKLNVDVMNNSWGALKKSEILEEAIEEANQKGIVFVAASGNNYANNDTHPRYPASYTNANVITVAAISPENRMTGFSCYGEKTVHIAAPGRNIMSTVPKNKYKVLSGTSMSAPYVTGAVGLYMSLRGRSEKPETIKNLMMKTATPVDHLQGRIYSGGRLDINSFLTEGQNL